MVELLIGAALGVGGMVAKNKVIDNNTSTSSSNLQKELDALSDENEKLRKRSKEAERQVEDLLAENQKLRKTSRATDDDRDDLEDELDSAKSKVKKLTQQNDELLRKIAEYKSVCENYEAEINRLKNN